MSFLFTGSGTPTYDPVIDTPPTRFTTTAGYSAALATILAGLVVIGQGLGFDPVNAPTPIKVALIGLVGLGILAWAIAATGDSLARAYALAHVSRTDPSKPNEPAIKTAAFRLAEVYAAANPAVDGQKAQLEAQKVAAAAQVRLCPFPAPLPVKAQGRDANAVAVLVSGETGQEQQRYLVGRPNSKLQWVDGDEIYLP